MTTSNEVPPSPRHLIRISTSSTESLALSDAMLGARSFASVSAAAFSAVIAPSSAAPQPRANVGHRYNTRLASRTSIENCQDMEVDHPPSRQETRHHRHVLPERASRLVATATANARLARVMNKSNELQRENIENSGASTPSKSNGSSVSNASPFRPILSNNEPPEVDRLPFGQFGQWRSSDSSSPGSNFGSLSSAITVGSSTLGSVLGQDNNDDSVIVLDDTNEDPQFPEVFRFMGAEKPNQSADESKGDSVLIVSPEKEENYENVSELVDEPEDLDGSICVTRHKVNRVCPITKLPFQEPMRNVCGHVYEKDAIREMVFSRWRRFKFCPCPVPGCQSKVLYSTLTNA